MVGFNFCQVCGTKLRSVAIFCLKCGRPSCCWRCHTRHLAGHNATAVGPPAGDTLQIVAEAHPLPATTPSAKPA